MIADRSTPDIAPEDYLAAEARRQLKHEYRDGLVYAMAGASDAHVTIAGNLFVLLRTHVRGTDCRVFIADMWVRVEAANCYYYPDVVVTCDPRDRDQTTAKQHPCLVVEVLSEATEGFDRGDKFADYRQLPSLQEYVLISQTRQRVDVFRRDAAGAWVLTAYATGAELPLHSIDFACPVDALYEDVELAAPVVPESA